MGAGGRGTEELLFDRYRLSVLHDRKVLETHYNKVNILNATQLYALKWLRLRFYIMCILPRFPNKIRTPISSILQALNKPCLW